MNIIILPFPISVNALYAGKSRRYKSPRYKAWITEAEFALMQQKPLPVIKGNVNVWMKFGRPDKRRRDVANYEKCVSDLLVTWQIIEDDSLIDDNRQTWWPDVVGVQVEIEHDLCSMWNDF